MLHEQLAGSELGRVDVPIGAGLDDILEMIRIHWERDVEKNRMEAGALLPAEVRGGTLHSALCRRRPSEAEMQSASKGRNAAVSSH